MNRESRAPLGQGLGAAAAGWALLGVGAVLLVLPGPGIPLVLTGLVLLGRERPWARRLHRRLRRTARRAVARVRRGTRGTAGATGHRATRAIPGPSRDSDARDHSPRRADPDPE